MLQSYFYTEKTGSSQRNFSDLKSDRKNTLFKNIVSTVEKMHILNHFHFQKDVNIVSSPFFPLCVLGEFQVIGEQHFELKNDEQKGHKVAPYTCFSFSLNKCYMCLLWSPVNILKSFLMKILILIQWITKFSSSSGTAWGPERLHSNSSDTDRLKRTTAWMRFRFWKAGVQDFKASHARSHLWCWQERHCRSVPFWTCEEPNIVP